MGVYSLSDFVMSFRVFNSVLTFVEHQLDVVGVSYPKMSFNSVPRVSCRLRELRASWLLKDRQALQYQTPRPDCSTRFFQADSFLCLPASSQHTLTCLFSPTPITFSRSYYRLQSTKVSTSILQGQDLAKRCVCGTVPTPALLGPDHPAFAWSLPSKPPIGAS